VKWTYCRGYTAPGTGEVSDPSQKKGSVCVPIGKCQLGYPKTLRYPESVSFCLKRGSGLMPRTFVKVAGRSKVVKGTIPDNVASVGRGSKEGQGDPGETEHCVRRRVRKTLLPNMEREALYVC
jgi:hypothetical protein